MEYLLVVGLTGWLAMAFLGARESFRNGDPPLAASLRVLKARHAGVMLPLAMVALLLAAGLVHHELNGIRRGDGVVGLWFGLSVLAGVAGAVLASARLYLSVGD